jgi:hypothetical protein
MSDVAGARGWAAHMEAAVHRPDCHLEKRVFVGHGLPLGVETIHPDPGCTGCVTPEHRRLWRQLRREYDRYLGRQSS